MLLDEGRPDIVEWLDARLRDIDLGLTGARSTWHSISEAQRRVLVLVTSRNRRLVRRSGSKTLYDAVGQDGTVEKAAGILTVRNLASRSLLAWDGGAFDPEAAAVMTEQAQFVVKHGPLK
jgi:hypothetical protein